MVTIDADADLVTLIVTFDVTPDTQDARVALLEEVVKVHAQHDGFVSCTIHRSRDGYRVAEYIQWRSMAHLEAMLSAPGALAHTEGGVVHDGRVYDIVSVTEAPAA